MGSKPLWQSGQNSPARPRPLCAASSPRRCRVYVNPGFSVVARCWSLMDEERSPPQNCLTFANEIHSRGLSVGKLSGLKSLQPAISVLGDTRVIHQRGELIKPRECENAGRTLPPNLSMFTRWRGDTTATIGSFAVGKLRKRLFKYGNSSANHLVKQVSLTTDRLLLPYANWVPKLMLHLHVRSTLQRPEVDFIQVPFIFHYQAGRFIKTNNKKYLSGIRQINKMVEFRLV